MKGKKISAIKLSVLIVMFVMLVATVLYDHFYVVERNLPGYVKEYERYTSFSGVIDDIEAWRLSDTDDSSPVFESVSSAYITNDPYVISPVPDDIRIRVVGIEGARWFAIDKGTFIFNGVRDERGGYRLRVGQNINLAYTTKGDNSLYAVAIKCSVMKDLVTGLSVMASLIFVFFVIMLWPVYDPERETSRGIISAWVILAFIVLVTSVVIWVAYKDYMKRARNAMSSVAVHAPIIYLYDDACSDVNIRLDLKGDLTETYPLYDEGSGWNVTTSPDGMLTGPDGDNYRFLYWEADLDMDYDLSRGYCVRGCDTEGFLDEALRELGLNETEAFDFKAFWLPFMEANPYNVITFQTTAYTDVAVLDVTPSPDVTVRVNMLWYPSSEYVSIEPQDLSGMNPSLEDRRGLTLVEWGGEVIQSGQ